jgi:hypothetical protein
LYVCDLYWAWMYCYVMCIYCAIVLLVVLVPLSSLSSGVISVLSIQSILFYTFICRSGVLYCKMSVRIVFVVCFSVR